MPSSLDVLEDVVRREYDAQERRAEALDTKAGLVLGFAGLLVSLTPATVWPPLTLLARVFAATAAVLALRVFSISATTLDLHRAANVAGTSTDARRRVLSTLLVAGRAAAVLGDEKLRRVRAALHLLATAVGIVVVGAAVDAVWTLRG